ncbi:Hypothetical predicted protein, partial [Paramuricea clavata]
DFAKSNGDYCCGRASLRASSCAMKVKTILPLQDSSNPWWSPLYFMVDFSTAEINAIEKQFPDVAVYICDFHHIQVWQRWHVAKSPQDTSTDCSKKENLRSDNSLGANGDLQNHVDEEEDVHSKPKQVENKDKQATQQRVIQITKVLNPEHLQEALVYADKIYEYLSRNCPKSEGLPIRGSPEKKHLNVTSVEYHQEKKDHTKSKNRCVISAPDELGTKIHSIVEKSPIKTFSFCARLNNAYECSNLPTSNKFPLQCFFKSILEEPTEQLDIPADFKMDVPADFKMDIPELTPAQVEPPTKMKSDKANRYTETNEVLTKSSFIGYPSRIWSSEDANIISLKKVIQLSLLRNHSFHSLCPIVFHLLLIVSLLSFGISWYLMMAETTPLCDTWSRLCQVPSREIPHSPLSFLQVSLTIMDNSIISTRALQMTVQNAGCRLGILQVQTNLVILNVFTGVMATSLRAEALTR